MALSQEDIDRIADAVVLRLKQRENEQREINDLSLLDDDALFAWARGE